MRLCIHRGSREIGGSCVELQAQGKRLLLDIGTPLVNDDRTRFDDRRLKRPVDELVAERLLPGVPGLYGDGPCDVVGIIVSHAHLDHYGLSPFVRPDVPVYVTEGTQMILDVSTIFVPNARPLANSVVIGSKWQPISLGPFTVTAYPVDHSAVDAIAIRVEADGQAVFYTGDFRGHGRKATLFEHMVAHPPHRIDVMLMEGSSIGRQPGEYPYASEESVETAMVESVTAANDLAMIFCSGQNIDRIVTAYKVARRTGRTLVYDLYQAYVLHKLKVLSANLPQYDWAGVRVKFWKHQQDALEAAGEGEFVKGIVCGHHGIKTDEIVEHRTKMLVLARANSLLRRFLAKFGDVSNMTMIWSMWSGYLTGDDVFSQLREESGMPWKAIHTSGHASTTDLTRLVAAVAPKRLVPIHTFHPDEYAQFGAPVTLLEDGMCLDLQTGSTGGGAAGSVDKEHELRQTYGMRDDA